MKEKSNFIIQVITCIFICPSLFLFFFVDIVISSLEDPESPLFQTWGEAFVTILYLLFLLVITYMYSQDIFEKKNNN